MISIFDLLFLYWNASSPCLNIVGCHSHCCQRSRCNCSYMSGIHATFVTSTHVTARFVDVPLWRKQPLKYYGASPWQKCLVYTHCLVWVRSWFCNLELQRPFHDERHYSTCIGVYKPPLFEPRRTLDHTKTKPIKIQDWPAFRPSKDFSSNLWPRKSLNTVWVVGRVLLGVIRRLSKNVWAAGRVLLGVIRCLEAFIRQHETLNSSAISWRLLDPSRQLPAFRTYLKDQGA